MSRSRRALVVCGESSRRRELSDWLATDGYDVDQVVGFINARRSLEVSHPDLLVSDVKLEAYNGLHLAIWSRGQQLGTQTVLIGEPDLVLEREAERERAVYLSPPFDQGTFLRTVNALVESHRSRRSPRRRVSLDASVDGVVASVIDLSYEGVCIALHNAESLALPPFFTLRVPAYDIACRVQRVWTGRPASARGTLLCGAELPAAETPSAASWRALVDTVISTTAATG